MALDSSSSLVSYNPEQLPPENSSFLERSFMCRFRCLLDNSSGFLALNIQGRLKFLLGQNQQQENGGKATPQLALFAIATPLQPPSILEIRTKNMIFRTKHKLDFTPLACDAKGKIVLGYTEAELRVRGSGYQFIHAADMLYCAENHVRMMKTGESGLTVFRLLTKENRWKWVQANARLVYKNGKPDYIIATQRPLLEEEGGEHLHKRSMHLLFTYATGEALLYQSNHPIAGFSSKSVERSSSKSKKSRSERLVRDGLDPGSLLGALMTQDESVYVSQPAEPSSFSGEQTELSHRSWDEPENRGVGEPSDCFDPLLATLDSLSLENGGVVEAEEGTCSNGELFLALEGLGLSAEDLELLLLDDRMIRVEMDPEHVPTLDELLTNDEILSYIYDSIDGRTDPTAREAQLLANATAASASDGCSSSDSKALVQSAHREPPLGGQAPIVLLSQQMQQHLNMRTGVVAQAWNQHHVTNGELMEQNLSLSQQEWTAQDILVTAGIQLRPVESQPTVVSGEDSGLDGNLHQHYLHQQQQLSLQKTASLNSLYETPVSGCSAGQSQWQDFNLSERVDNSPCLGTSPRHHPNTSLASYLDPSTADAHHVGETGLFGRSGRPDEGKSLQEMNLKQHQEQFSVPLAQVISSLSHGPPPNTSLEEILGVGKSCHQLDQHVSEICHDSSLSKMEKGCMLNTSYPEGFALPNGDRLAPPTVQSPGPETDPGPTDFYL